jgi:hypothetical protein
MARLAAVEIGLLSVFVSEGSEAGGVLVEVEAVDDVELAGVLDLRGLSLRTLLARSGARLRLLL